MQMKLKKIPLFSFCDSKAYIFGYTNYRDLKNLFSCLLHIIELKTWTISKQCKVFTELRSFISASGEGHLHTNSYSVLWAVDQWRTIKSLAMGGDSKAMNICIRLYSSEGIFRSIMSFWFLPQPVNQVKFKEEEVGLEMLSDMVQLTQGLWPMPHCCRCSFTNRVAHTLTPIRGETQSTHFIACAWKAAHF